MDNQERRDAMLCLELLVEVLSLEPCGLLSDLVHLISKSNMMRARNDIIDNVSNSLMQQIEKIAEKK